MSRATQDTALKLKNYLYGTFTLFGPNFHYGSNSFLIQFSQSYNPNHALLHHWFGLLRVRSPLLAQSLLFSSPMGNEMFQFPTFAFLYRNDIASLCRVSPFGNPRIKGYLHLPAAYHVLLRLPEPRHPPFALICFFYLFLLVLIFKNKACFISKINTQYLISNY